MARRLGQLAHVSAALGLILALSAETKALALPTPPVKAVAARDADAQHAGKKKPPPLTLAQSIPEAMPPKSGVPEPVRCGSTATRRLPTDSSGSGDFGPGATPDHVGGLHAIACGERHAFVAVGSPVAAEAVRRACHAAWDTIIVANAPPRGPASRRTTE